MATAADKQEMEADIVVIGYSGAGATEARPVHDNDATVIVLRKCPPGLVHYSSTGNLASDRLNDWAKSATFIGYKVCLYDEWQRWFA